MVKISRTLCLSLAFLFLLGIGANLQAGVIRVQACEFMPTMHFYQGTWYRFPNRIYITDCPNAGEAEFIAPLKLPDNANIKQIRIYFLNEQGDAWMNVHFFRANLSTGEEEIFAERDCPNGTGRQSIVIPGSEMAFKRIDNNKYSYSILLHFSSNSSPYVCLHYVEIEY